MVEATVPSSECLNKPPFNRASCTLVLQRPDEGDFLVVLFK